MKEINFLPFFGPFRLCIFWPFFGLPFLSPLGWFWPSIFFIGFFISFHFISSTISNEITRFHHNYKFFKNMLIKLCVGNYFMLDGIVNVVYGTFVNYTKTIQTCCYG